MTGILSSTVGTFIQSGIRVSTLATRNIKTAGTNNLNSASISMTAGRIYVVLLAWDISGLLAPSVTLSDTANTYSALSNSYFQPDTSSTAGTGIVTQSFITTAGATASRTITATFSASITAKSMIVFEVIGATTTKRNADTVQVGTTADPSYTSPSANLGDLMFSFVAQEAPVGSIPTAGPTDTRGTWSSTVNSSTSGGSAATNIMLAYEFAVVTSAGTQTIGWTLPSTNNWASVTHVLQKA